MAGPMTRRLANLGGRSGPLTLANRRGDQTIGLCGSINEVRGFDHTRMSSAAGRRREEGQHRSTGAGGDAAPIAVSVKQVLDKSTQNGP
jgi:hypothetical protein